MSDERKHEQKTFSGFAHQISRYYVVQSEDFLSATQDGRCSVFLLQMSISFISRK